MTTPIPDPHLALHQLFSPAFPTGSFAWSHGLEAATQAGHPWDAASLQDWIATVLTHGAGRSDSVIMARAALGDDPRELSAFAIALSPSSERRAESREQGHAFMRTVNALWPLDLPLAPYPVATGLAVRALALPLADALAHYLHAMLANLVHAGLRLMPLGQTDGQRITSALHPLVIQQAACALTADLDDLGGFAPLLDIASQSHACLYSRIFRA